MAGVGLVSGQRAEVLSVRRGWRAGAGTAKCKHRLASRSCTEGGVPVGKREGTFSDLTPVWWQNLNGYTGKQYTAYPLKYFLFGALEVHPQEGV